jgi:hypothetical protein
MREEISEPQHWRICSAGSTSAVNSWAGHRCQHDLPVEAVDAAFKEETTRITPARASQRDLTARTEGERSPSRLDIVQSLSAQLVMLEAQREQLQKLLDETQG